MHVKSIWRITRLTQQESWRSCLYPCCASSLGEEHANDTGAEIWSHSLLGKALKDKMNSSSPHWLEIVDHQLQLAISTIGRDFFRVHPKGHGSIVLKPSLKANTLVMFYCVKVYPSWRWGKKMDSLELTQTRLGLRPNLPDFYNRALERPQSDPRGHGLPFVDGSRARPNKVPHCRTVVILRAKSESLVRTDNFAWQ
jgi:hypothetical protein